LQIEEETILKIDTFFTNPSIWGIILAILFGGFWLVLLSPLKLKRYSTWLVFLGSVLIFAPVIVFIQVPLQNLIGFSLVRLIGEKTYIDLILFTGIPTVLISGLVQEGAKLAPPVFYWLFQGKNINAKVGLTIGAMAGAGVGIFEAQWINNMILASGWNFGLTQTYGVLALAGFWERFFTVGFHISIGALTGWGLAKGWGWQYYLFASLIHGILNYAAILAQTGKFSSISTEIYISVVALAVFGCAFWLRRRNVDNPEESDGEPEIKIY
jgi:hypothetical protein